jgi:twitching motility two-component system response regulator PilH
MPGPDRAAKTVLVVEDETDIAEVVGTVLETEGYDVVYAANGEEGLAALGDEPDLVLVDSTMPVLGGRAMVRAMQADPKRASIPVMMMSGAVSVEEGLTVPLIRKPFEIEELLRKIERLIGRP